MPEGGGALGANENICDKASMKAGRKESGLFMQKALLLLPVNGVGDAAKSHAAHENEGKRHGAHVISPYSKWR